MVSLFHYYRITHRETLHIIHVGVAVWFVERAGGSPFGEGGGGDAGSESGEGLLQQVLLLMMYYGFRMFDMCTSKCNAASLDEDDQLGRDNCMDRCLVKFDETKKVVERELEKKADSSSLCVC